VCGGLAARHAPPPTKDQGVRSNSMTLSDWLPSYQPRDSQQSFPVGNNERAYPSFGRGELFWKLLISRRFKWNCMWSGGQLLEEQWNILWNKRRSLVALRLFRLIDTRHIEHRWKYGDIHAQVAQLDRNLVVRSVHRYHLISVDSTWSVGFGVWHAFLCRLGGWLCASMNVV